MLFVAAGITLSSASVLKTFAFLVLVVVLSVKARFEESLLAERFPDYDAYARRTPRLIPRLGGMRGLRR